MTKHRNRLSVVLRRAGFVLCAASLSAPHVAIAASFTSGPPVPFTASNAGELDAKAQQQLALLNALPGPWGWRELVDRGRVAVALGDFAGAAAMFEAARRASSPGAERVATELCWANALIAAAQALPGQANGQNPRRAAMLRQAGEILNETQRAVPMSRGVASARLTAWSLLGDELETLVAEHQLRVIDPSLEGIPRCEPMTLGLIALIVFVGGRYALSNFQFEGVLEPEQRLALLRIFDDGARVTSGLLSGKAVIDVFSTEASK